jgi:hypothetical protein
MNGIARPSLSEENNCGPMSSCSERLNRVHFCQMRQTITIRLSKDLAAWLEDTAAKSGVSQGKLVRDQLEKARASNGAQAFMRLAGTVRGPKDLSKRKGFSRS